MSGTILITWWTWYIWSHAVVTFEKAGFKTVIVDNLINSKLSVLDWIQKILWYKPDFYKIDLLNDYEQLENIFKKYNFDWVLHFAWLKAVWESCQKLGFYYKNNLQWSINLFEIMSKNNVRNMIFSSSCTVYWKINYLPFDEQHPLNETSNPYSHTKQILEWILKKFSQYKWFNVIVLRYFNPIWNHPSWFIWENPNWVPNNLFPYIFKVLKWELDYLRIFGDDYDTKDWTWLRDYINVVDLVEWHLKAYNYLLSNKKDTDSNWFYDIFNLGLWKWYTVLELVDKVQKISQKKVPYKIVARRPWDVDKLYWNIDKAKKFLNWVPKISIEESIEQMLKFWKI